MYIRVHISSLEWLNVCTQVWVSLTCIYVYVCTCILYMYECMQVHIYTCIHVQETHTWVSEQGFVVRRCVSDKCVYLYMHIYPSYIANCEVFVRRKCIFYLRRFWHMHICMIHYKYIYIHTQVCIFYIYIFVLIYIHIYKLAQAQGQALALAFCAYICETGLIHIKDKTQSFMYKLRKSACSDILWLTSFWSG